MDERRRRPAPTIYQGYRDEESTRRPSAERPGSMRESRPSAEGAGRSRENRAAAERPESSRRTGSSATRLESSRGTGSTAARPESSRETRAAAERSGTPQRAGTEARQRASRSEVERGSRREVPVRKRKRSYEDQVAMRGLSIALVILVILLVAAIIYEVVLGNGTKATGSQRMESESQVTLLVEEEPEVYGEA